LEFPVEVVDFFPPFLFLMVSMIQALFVCYNTSYTGVAGNLGRNLKRL
jgi:hypothetical protein